MSKKNNAQSKKDNVEVANVPNPPVPNRARTEMKNQSNQPTAKNKANSKAENWIKFWKSLLK